MCYDCCVVVWRESVVIGETSMGAQEVQEVVQQLGSEYKGTAYHLLERNCNHFSNELCLKLTGKPAPLWVILLVPESPLSDPVCNSSCCQSKAWRARDDLH